MLELVPGHASSAGSGAKLASDSGKNVLAEGLKEKREERSGEYLRLERGLFLVGSGGRQAQDGSQ